MGYETWTCQEEEGGGESQDLSTQQSNREQHLCRRDCEQHNDVRDVRGGEEMRELNERGTEEFDKSGNIVAKSVSSLHSRSKSLFFRFVIATTHCDSSLTPNFGNQET